MADNTQLNTGTGGDVIATDDIAGVKYPRSKVGFGADGSYTDTSTSNPLPVVQTGTPALPTGAATETTLSALNTKVTAVNTGAVVVSSSALPTGASTAAKQPALGTAGTPSADVLTVQGVTSMTALKVDGSAVTQPVSDASGSLTVDAPVGTPVFVRLSDGSAAISTLPVSLASVPSHAVTNAGTFAVQAASAGDVANDGVDSGNPIKVGAQARDTVPTAVADADRVNLTATLTGKQITLPDAIPAATWNYAAPAGGLVTTTGVTAKAAAGAGIRNYIRSVQVYNSHQTIGTEVVIRDGAAGTVLHRGWAQQAGGGYAHTFSPPLRGSANTLVEIAEITTTGTAGVLVDIQGYSAAE